MAGTPSRRPPRRGRIPHESPHVVYAGAGPAVEQLVCGTLNGGIGYTSPDLGGWALPPRKESQSLTHAQIRKLQEDFLGTPGRISAPSKGPVRSPSPYPVVPVSWDLRTFQAESPPPTPRSGGTGGGRWPPTGPLTKTYPKLTPEALGHLPRPTGPVGDLPGRPGDPSPSEALPATRPESPLGDPRVPATFGTGGEPLPDRGTRDLWHDGAYRDVYRDPGAQDLVRDRGFQDSVALGATLSSGLLTEITLVGSVARSGGFTAQRGRSGPSVPSSWPVPVEHAISDLAKTGPGEDPHRDRKRARRGARKARRPTTTKARSSTTTGAMARTSREPGRKRPRRIPNSGPLP